jgi:hypothetical protein
VSYPKYTVPSVGGVTLSLGAAPAQPVQPDDQRFCTLEDAKTILKVFTDLGVADATLVDASMGTVNGEHFNNVDPTSLARPWYLFSSKVVGPVGPALWLQYGPNTTNGGGRGNPGAWEGVLSGNPRYVPAPIPSVTPMPTASNPADAGAFANVQGVNNLQSDVTEIKRLVIAMAATIGIK